MPGLLQALRWPVPVGGLALSPLRTAGKGAVIGCADCGLIRSHNGPLKGWLLRDWWALCFWVAHDPLVANKADPKASTHVIPGPCHRLQESDMG
ncbi:unnamed protein product [Clonostachys chloroleuca]|uniref:Uncharacterized protein n=1 Tax=Clonostachys chloroleuca TaxID=1926264 RepID=A0AA35M135_9HYPO|nr:unnamed protein product [Clonostachys chloroleuca]